jgi:hypothetical protein
MNKQQDKLSKILSLLHDPTFVTFELEQEAPSIFNAVGRTHTETWHSALLGWLFNPNSSHSLGVFPLNRLFLLLQVQEQQSLKGYNFDLNDLLARGDFSEARARPNEKELAEVSVVGVGRFDVFVDKMKLDPWEEIQLIIETKVRGRIDKKQCRKYIEYVELKKSDNVFILPIFVAPTSHLIGSPKELFGNDAWMSVDYQSIYDEVIEPCVQHPSISEFGKFTLLEYTKTLKYRQQGDEPLAVTQKERDLVDALMERHELAIRALYEILSQSRDEFEEIEDMGEQTKNLIKIKIKNRVFEQPSLSKLYQEVLKYLYNENYLSNVELPVATGAKRYLLATEPRHPLGNQFVRPVKHQSYYMESHKSRDGGLHDLAKLLELCGLTMQVISK